MLFFHSSYYIRSGKQQHRNSNSVQCVFGSCKEARVSSTTFLANASSALVTFGIRSVFAYTLALPSWELHCEWLIPHDTGSPHTFTLPAQPVSIMGHQYIFPHIPRVPQVHHTTNFGLKCDWQQYAHYDYYTKWSHHLIFIYLYILFKIIRVKP